MAYSLFETKNASCLIVTAWHASTSSVILKDVLSDLIPKEQARIKNFTQLGKTVVGQIIVDMVYGGMKGMKGLVYKMLVLDPDEGIHSWGYKILKCQKLLPKAKGDE